MNIKSYYSHAPFRRFSDSQIIEVSMGDGVVTRTPHIIWSKGLGSCVVVVLYDTRRKIGGLAHIMLPDSSQMQNPDCRMGNPKSTFDNRHSTIDNSSYRCADTAIAALLEGLQSKGATLQDMVAKMVGGARMFSDYNGSSTSVGAENIMSIKHILRRERIPLMGQDVGGNYGRSIEFHLDSGKVIVKAIDKEDREI